MGKKSEEEEHGGTRNTEEESYSYRRGLIAGVDKGMVLRHEGEDCKSMQAVWYGSMCLGSM